MRPNHKVVNHILEPAEGLMGGISSEPSIKKLAITGDGKPTVTLYICSYNWPQEQREGIRTWQKSHPPFLYSGRKLPFQGALFLSNSPYTN
jgi:hypothetical protein